MVTRDCVSRWPFTHQWASCNISCVRMSNCTIRTCTRRRCELRTGVLQGTEETHQRTFRFLMGSSFNVNLQKRWHSYSASIPCYNQDVPDT